MDRDDAGDLPGDDPHDITSVTSLLGMAWRTVGSLKCGVRQYAVDEVMPAFSFVMAPECVRRH